MKIFDSVHGFIHFNDLEGSLIDTEPFQRLRYIHQLGILYLVYPGGTHTRFEHSIGTMHLATQIFDHIAPNEKNSYFRQVVRLAALCHDLGHLPFSHVAEKELLGKGGHEEWTLKIIESDYLEPVWEKGRGIYKKPNFRQDVLKYALGEEKLKILRPEIQFSAWDRVYSEVVTGDFFGADRIDYLLRDARATGLNYGIFDYVQLIEMLRIISDGEVYKIAVEENGIESCEALLLARHFMKQRVYQYPTARAYSFHLARFMKILYGNSDYFHSVEKYISLSEYEVLCQLKGASKDPKHPGHLDASSLMDRKKRFQVIQLPKQMGLQDLQNFKNEKKIPEEMIHWELTEENYLKQKLFPNILQKNKTVTSAESLFEIAIPKSKKGWLYLSPEYSEMFNSLRTLHN